MPYTRPAAGPKGASGGLRATLLSCLAALLGLLVFSAVQGGLFFPSPGQGVLVSSKLSIFRSADERIPRTTSVVLSFPLFQKAVLVDLAPSEFGFDTDLAYGSGLTFKLIGPEVRHTVRMSDAQRAASLNLATTAQRQEILPHLYAIAVRRAAVTKEGSWALSDAETDKTLRKAGSIFKDLAARIAMDVEVVSRARIRFPRGSEAEVRALRTLHAEEKKLNAALTSANRDEAQAQGARGVQRQKLLQEIRARFKTPLAEARVRLHEAQGKADEAYQLIHSQAQDRRELLEIEADTLTILAQHEADGLTDMADAFADGGQRVLDYILATQVMPQLEAVGTHPPSVRSTPYTTPATDQGPEDSEP